MRTLLISLRLAWRTLMLNKVRSVLTLLGMIIGVGAVIAIVSLGEGLRADFQNQMSALGSDVFYMTPLSPKRPGQAQAMPKLFKMDDMLAIERGDTIVRRVVPGIAAGATVKHRDKTMQTTMNGVNHDYLDYSATAKLDTGRFFTKAEQLADARVVIIGEQLAKDLFAEWESPIGTMVKVNGVGYQVIGKFKSYSGMVTEGGSLNESLAAPLTTVQHRVVGSDDVFWVSMYLDQGADVTLAKEQVAAIMRQQRRIRNAADDDFQFITPEDFMQMGNQVINVMVGVFGGVAFISLMVGGVGIMNIMLVSVTERTREIGLRMALGAGRPAVLNQFLVESIVLTLLGGVLGLALGFVASVGVAKLLNKLLEATWEPHIPPLWVAYSVGVSILIGVLFGVYPAFKASRLDPVQAMGYE